MPVIISDNIIVSPTENPLNTPVFLWDNLLTVGGVTAVDPEGDTNADPDWPAANLANPSTAARWQAFAALSGAVYLTADIDSLDEIDAVGIAVHNLGSSRHILSVEGSIGGTPTWETLVQENMLANDDPALFRFTPQTLTAIRLKIEPGSPASAAVPYVAVMYVGKLLVCERGTHTDHMPITMGRHTREMTGVSESGHFLGRLITSEGRETSLALKFLRASWYRENFDPFVDAARTEPFFFAWRPQTYPNDVGYCWLTDDPKPSTHFDTGRIQVQLNMAGVAGAV